MKPIREITYRNFKWKCRVEFFPDRIDYAWDKYGLGVEASKIAILREALSPHLSEGTSSGGYLGGTAFRGGLFATFAVFSFALLPLPWRYLGYFFVLSALMSFGFVLSQFRKKEWISILKKDGDTAVGINVTGWTESSRSEFKAFYRDWLEGPNKAPEPTPGAVTPRAIEGDSM